MAGYYTTAVVADINYSRGSQFNLNRCEGLIKGEMKFYRIENIIDFLTKAVWRYTSRGLYEQHKFLFTLLLALKIDMAMGNVSHAEFLYLLKGGASLDLNSVKVGLSFKVFPLINQNCF